VTNLEILREQWMWNAEARRIWLWLFFIAGLVLAGVLWPVLGPAALLVGLLPLAASGALIGAIFAVVGKKVRALKDSLAGEPSDMAEAMVQIGGVQCPAIAILTYKELVLVPLAGERLIVPLADMESVREGRSLYGKGFVWKCAFLVKAPQNKRIGFAVAPSVAERWRPLLRRAGRKHV
jgi:hypothetical protein